ncbi:MAG: histidine phosphatase family protein [Peptostreptococcaceae bacterium]
MKIYLTRHGETEWNLIKKMHGHKNANLTQKGVDAAKKLGYSLDDVEFDIIYSSPIERALDTAKYIRGNKTTKIATEDSLKELNFGKWEGMFEKDCSEEYPEQFNNLWYKPEVFEPVEGGERLQELMQRIEIWFNENIKNSKYENILIVTHGVVNRAFYTVLKNNPIEKFWEEPYILNTALTIIEINENKIEFILEADTSHLKEFAKNK